MKYSTTWATSLAAASLSLHGTRAMSAAAANEMAAAGGSLNPARPRVTKWMRRPAKARARRTSAGATGRATPPRRS